MADLKFDKKDFDFFSKQIKVIEKQPVEKKELSDMGRSIVRSLKNLISRGISPIHGRGAFPAYKDSYKKALRRIKPGKSPELVNLKLSGKFLKSLGFETRGKRSILVGYSDFDAQAKEDGHRKGTNKQRKRPTIPIKNERFKDEVTDRAKKMFAKSIINKIKKKF